MKKKIAMYRVVERSRGFHSLSFLLIAILGLLFSSPANATDQLDMSVGFKTLLQMADELSGPVNVAVVFDPASSESKADAETIKGNVDKGAGVPTGVKLSVQVVNVTDFEKLSGIKVAFLAKDVSSGLFDSIARAAASKGILTISTDLECVKTNKCVLGVVSKPRVQIYYSQAAANASHIRFESTFILLVKQVGSGGDGS